MFRFLLVAAFVALSAAAPASEPAVPAAAASTFAAPVVNMQPAHAVTRPVAISLRTPAENPPRARAAPRLGADAARSHSASRAADASFIALRPLTCAQSRSPT